MSSSPGLSCMPDTDAGRGFSCDEVLGTGLLGGHEAAWLPVAPKQPPSQLGPGLSYDDLFGGVSPPSLSLPAVNPTPHPSAPHLTLLPC